MASKVLTTVLGAFVILATVTHTYATTFTVGGSRGWIVPNSGLNYTSWANNITARVGDSLYFKYNPNGHDVVKVNSTAFAACNITDYLQIWDTGDTTVLLEEPSTHYFLCGAPNHCNMGQAFAIQVLAAEDGQTPAGSAPGVLYPPQPSVANIIRRSPLWVCICWIVVVLTTHLRF